MRLSIYWIIRLNLQPIVWLRDASRIVVGETEGQLAAIVNPERRAEVLSIGVEPEANEGRAPLACDKTGVELAQAALLGENALGAGALPPTQQCTVECNHVEVEYLPAEAIEELEFDEVRLVFDIGRGLITCRIPCMYKLHTVYVGLTTARISTPPPVKRFSISWYDNRTVHTVYYTVVNFTITLRYQICSPLVNLAYLMAGP